MTVGVSDCAVRVAYHVARPETLIEPFRACLLDEVETALTRICIRHRSAGLEVGESLPERIVLSAATVLFDALRRALQYPG